jgi:hypothetical protein
MTTSFDLNHKLVESYLALLQNLSIEARLELISRISMSLKKPNQEPHKVDYYSGSWQSDESAEETIENIRSSRVFNRQIEEF